MQEQVPQPSDNEFEKEAFRAINSASKVPTYDSVKDAFTFVQTFVDSVTWVHHWQDIQEKIYPKLRELELVLYGGRDDQESRNLRAKNNVTLSELPNGEKVMQNSQNVLNEMRGVMVLAKRFHYEESQLAPIPEIERLIIQEEMNIL